MNSMLNYQKYDRQPWQDIKIVLGDFNAKTGREVVYQSVAGKGSLHEFCNNNGWRLKDFVTMENMNSLRDGNESYDDKAWRHNF
jgi:hypothetical protein